MRTKCEFAALAQKAAFVRVAELNFRLHRVAHLQRSRLCSSGTICPFFQGDTNRGVRMRRTNPNTIATTIALHSNQLFDKRSLMACLYSVIRLRRPSSESIVPLHLRPLMNQRFLPNQTAARERLMHIFPLVCLLRLLQHDWQIRQQKDWPGFGTRLGEVPLQRVKTCLNLRCRQC